MLMSRHSSRTRRLFTRRRSRLSTCLLALAAVIITACTEGPPPPPPPNYSDIQLEWETLTHDVVFADRQGALDADELSGIEGFLDAAAVRLTDEIALAPAAGSDRASAAARADALAAQLRRRLPGVRVRLLGNSRAATDRLMVGRYVAIMPECAGWQTPEQRFAAFRNPDNQVNSNFGCATAKNLTAMVANPGDLRQGRALTPANASGQALAIERYRRLESPHPHSPTTLKGNEVE